MNDFDVLFEQYVREYVFEQIDLGPSIGFFPGGFKPPTVFHYKALQAVLGDEPDTDNPILLKGDPSSYVHVIIGHAPRGSKDQNEELVSLKKDINSIKKRVDYKDDTSSVWPVKNRGEVSVSGLENQLKQLSGKMIDTVSSKNIWNLYTKGMKNVNVEISTDASPVKGMEAKIKELEPEDFANTIHLYAGQEDIGRFQYYTSDTFKQDLVDSGKAPTIKNINIEICELARLGSATDVRDGIRDVAIGKRSVQSLSEFIPDHVDPEEFYSHLNQFTNARYN